MTAVFLSYRREDTQYITGFLHQHLVQSSVFGPSSVFMDIDGIPPGIDFRDVIDDAMGKCRFFLAVIGPNWATVSGEDGSPRIKSPNDFVRMEIEGALRRKIPVIPVLVDRASMPRADQLPESLHPLLFKNAVTIRPGKQFQSDVDELIRGMLISEELLARKAPPPEPPSPPDTPKPIELPAPSISSPLTEPAAAKRWMQKILYVTAAAIAISGIALAWYFGIRPVDDVERSKSKSGTPMVFVPAGVGYIGDPRWNLKAVEFSKGFYMGKYEVTQAEWRSVMGTNPSWFSRTGGGSASVAGIPEADVDRFPVESVTWNDVQTFLTKLNAKPAAQRDDKKYRLPTGAEWQYACHGGAISREESQFEFYFTVSKSDATPARFNNPVPKDRLNSEEAGFGRPTVVGTYPPNSLGLHDMHGNVWEWTSTEWFGGGGSRDYYGGSWSNSHGYCTASFSHASQPDKLNSNIGFRLAADDDR